MKVLIEDLNSLYRKRLFAWVEAEKAVKSQSGGALIQCPLWVLITNVLTVQENSHHTMVWTSTDFYNTETCHANPLTDSSSAAAHVWEPRQTSLQGSDCKLCELTCVCMCVCVSVCECECVRLECLYLSIKELHWNSLALMNKHSRTFQGAYITYFICWTHNKTAAGLRRNWTGWKFFVPLEGTMSWIWS